MNGTDTLSMLARDLPRRSDLATPNARRAIGRNGRFGFPSFDTRGTSDVPVCGPAFGIPRGRRFPDECSFRATISKIESNVLARSL